MSWAIFVAQLGQGGASNSWRVRTTSLGGGGRRGGAHVGGEIGDGEIGLVADAGDDGNGAGGNGARDGFFVESPEVFERAAAAREDENVGKLLAVEIFDGLRRFRRPRLRPARARDRA